MTAGVAGGVWARRRGSAQRSVRAGEVFPLHQHKT